MDNGIILGSFNNNLEFLANLAAESPSAKRAVWTSEDEVQFPINLLCLLCFDGHWSHHEMRRLMMDMKECSWSVWSSLESAGEATEKVGQLVGAEYNEVDGYITINMASTAAVVGKYFTPIEESDTHKVMCTRVLGTPVFHLVATN